MHATDRARRDSIERIERARLKLAPLLALAVLLASLVALPSLADAIERNAREVSPQRPTEVIGGSPGRALPCLDVRTGGRVKLQARRLFATGAADTSWVPDSSSTCVGVLDGYSQWTLEDGAGGSFVVWADRSGPGAEVRLARLDPAGAPAVGWRAEGLAIGSPGPARDHVAGCSDGAGGVYLAWSEFVPAGPSEVRVAHLGAGGEPLPDWPPSGLAVRPSGGEQVHPWLAALSDGVLVTWLERRAGRLALRGQRLSAGAGTASGWPAEGVELAVAPGGGHVVHQRALARGGDEVLLVWREQQGAGTSLIRATQFRPDGAPRPLIEVPALSAAAAMQSDPTVVLSGEHAFVAWAERDPGGEVVRIQRLTAAGLPDPAWPAEGAVVARSALGFDPPAVLPSGDGGAFVAWCDRREIGGDIYATRVGPDGHPDPAWPAGGTPVATALGEQYRPHLSPDGVGGLIASWLDAGSETPAGYLSLRAGAEGRVELRETILDPGRVQLSWQAHSLEGSLCRAYKRTEDTPWQLLSELTPDSKGMLKLDDRAAPEGRPAGYVISSEREGVERFLAPVWVEVPAAPDRLDLRWVRYEGSGFVVGLALPRGPEARVEVMDIQGRRVAERRLTGFEPGVRSAEVRGPAGMRPGIYFVRLHQGEVTLTRKVVAVR
jgi:hypothetical protein